MSKTKDRTGKKFFSNPKHFAELINVSVLNARFKTNADDLTPQDPVINKVLGKHKSLEVLIDKLYKASYFDDKVSTYCLLGLENQAVFDKHMVIRVGLASLLLYDWQLSSIKKDEKLKLNYIIVLNMSDDEWKDPYSLRELISNEDLEYFGFLQTNVELIVVDPHTLDSSVINSLKTDLKYVLNTIKLKSDEKGLLNYIYGEEYFRNPNKITQELVAALANIELPNDGGNDMCKAIEDMKQHSFEAGEANGKAEGKAETLYELTHEGIISGEFAAKKLNITISEYEKNMKAYFNK